MIRTFIGIPVPELIGNKLINSLQKNSNFDSNAILKLETLEKLHITLHFFGNVDVEKLPILIKNLKNAFATYNSFLVETRKIAYFPQYNQHIIAAYVEPSTLLKKLYAKTQHTIKKSCFDTESRNFIPHITLARVKSLASHAHFNGFEFNLKFKVSEIILYESKQDRNGSVYIPIHPFKLVEI